MKILEEKRAPNPRRVRIFLAEKSIDVPYEPVDIMKGEHRTPEFSALNPAQTVPVLLLDNGDAISETMAICRYFEALQPEPSLFGESPEDIARIEMWNRRAELGFFFPVAQCFRHSHPAMAVLESPQIASWAEVNKPRVARMVEILDRQLGNHPFIAGPSFSVADITALVAADFMKPARLPVPDEAVHFRRWHKQMAARPSASA
jgi:glutathione S-transferase